VDFPIENGGSFHSFLYVYQMVYFGIEAARLADPPHPTPPASPGGVAGNIIYLNGVFCHDYPWVDHL
jgi:hypothetical protein